MKTSPPKKARTKGAAKPRSREGVKQLDAAMPVSPAAGEPMGPPSAAEEKVAAAPQPVRLAVEGISAGTVCVAGCFNGWSTTATPMTCHEPGCWSVELSLPPGQYEYLLVVDGQWQTDPGCTRHVPNPYGGVNCILEVPPPA